MYCQVFPCVFGHGVWGIVEHGVWGMVRHSAWYLVLPCVFLQCTQFEFHIFYFLQVSHLLHCAGSH